MSMPSKRAVFFKLDADLMKTFPVVYVQEGTWVHIRFSSVDDVHLQIARFQNLGDAHDSFVQLAFENGAISSM